MENARCEFDSTINDAKALLWACGPSDQVQHIASARVIVGTRMGDWGCGMNKSTDTMNHRFDPMSIPGLSYRAREAVNATFDAMSTWRSEIADSSEKNSKRVIEKMAAAAAELGWPEQVVDAARAQLQNLTEAQIKTMNQVMDAWEEQLKLTDPGSPSAALNKSNSASGSAGIRPADAFQLGVTTPLQFWMSFAGQWQKSWIDMVTSWTNSQKSPDNKGRRQD